MNQALATSHRSYRTCAIHMVPENMNQARKGVRGLVSMAPTSQKRVHLWASFPNSYLPACIGFASLQIAYYAPGREMVWAKFSCLGRSLIWCNPSKSVNPILSNFAPSNPIVLQMIPKCSTCLLSSFHTSALKIVRGKIARTLVLVNLHSWVQP